jgi:hypothetical protein
MNNKEIGELLLKNYDGWKFTNYKGGVRLIPLKEYSGDDPCDKLPNGHKIREIIAPGCPGSNSSKFLTYVIEFNDTIYKLVYGRGRGGSKGLKAEDYLLSAILGNGSNEYWKKVSEQCLSSLGISRANIKFAYHPKDNKRKVGTVVEDIGKLVSDITIETKSRDYYLSLKCGPMWSVANIGAATYLSEERGRVTINKGHVVHNILSGVGFSDSNIVRAWEAYIKNLPAPKIEEDPEENKTYIRNILASSIGYGYLYCAITPYGESIKNLESEDDTYKIIGDVYGIERLYPLSKIHHNTRKEIKNIVYTGGGRYEIRVRNTDGGVLPNKCQINYCVNKNDIRYDPNGC